MNRNILKIAILALTAVGISFQANAQQGTTKEEPVSFSQKNLIWKDSIIVMPEFDLQALLLEDSIKRKLNRDNRAGYAYDVNFNLENSGEWKTLENGDRIWHLVLACPDAKSINVYYDKFWMPEGAKFFVYGKDREHCRGAYTSVNNGKGKTRTNPRLFFTGPIYDDTIVLEYYEPKNVMNQGILSVSSLVHNYRFFDKDRWFNKKNSGGLNASGSCQVNINCEEGWRWQNEKNAVALFSIDGEEWGTGALINNTAEDKRLLFLTANHCLNGSGDAISSPNCSNAVFFWHYESPNCNNLEEDPDYYIETVGATVLANDSVLDFALLELSIDSNDILNIMTYYLGWDRRPYLGADDSTAVGIHHPRGDIKKISTSRNIQSDGNHWMVLWKETEHGHSVTEPISSGSPLINGNNHVIGCLFGGESYDCSCPNKDTAYYNKLDRAWFGDDATDNRRKLQPWLDPLNTGATTLDGLMGSSNVNLYIRDSIGDNGNTPSNVKYMYNSPDIWIEELGGGSVDNPIGGRTYNVCVHIHNKRAVSSTGTEKLYLNWAKAGIDLPWPSGWDGEEDKDIGCDNPKKMSGNVGDSLCYSIPIILPYNSAVVKIPWTVPIAEDYNCGMFKDNAERWHFCLLARVHDSETIRYEDSDSCRIDTFVVRNNNVAWKNISVINGSNNKAVVWLQNHLSTTQKFRLHFTAHPNSKNELLGQYAETYIRLSPNVYEAWNAGGRKGTGISEAGENRLRITENNATLKDISLPANAVGMLETEVNFLSEVMPQDKTFTFDIAMYDSKGKTLYGGEHYMAIRDDNRTFDVVAMQNQTAMSEEPVTFSAVNIGEPATYVWYNVAGDSIASGTTLSTTATQSQQYRLSVQATADGYKGYDTVSVVVRSGAITSLSPNPATNQVVVSYALSNQVQGGTLQITNTNGVAVLSVPFTSAQTSATLNLQNLVAGQYSVRLVSATGEVLDSKTLIVQ